MSKIKNHLIDIYGDDWSARLEDIAQQKQRGVKHGQRS